MSLAILTAAGLTFGALIASATAFMTAPCASHIKKYFGGKASMTNLYDITLPDNGPLHQHTTMIGATENSCRDVAITVTTPDTASDLELSNFVLARGRTVDQYGGLRRGLVLPPHMERGGKVQYEQFGFKHHDLSGSLRLFVLPLAHMPKTPRLLRKNTVEEIPIPMLDLDKVIPELDLDEDTSPGTPRLGGRDGVEAIAPLDLNE